MVEGADAGGDVRLEPVRQQRAQRRLVRGVGPGLAGQAERAVDRGVGRGGARRQLAQAVGDADQALEGRRRRARRRHGRIPLPAGVEPSRAVT
jgi:hypothetical protein